jgi:hypothetical protein
METRLGEGAGRQLGGECGLQGINFWVTFMTKKASFAAVFGLNGRDRHFLLFPGRLSLSPQFPDMLRGGTEFCLAAICVYLWGIRHDLPFGECVDYPADHWFDLRPDCFSAVTGSSGVTIFSGVPH